MFKGFVFERDCHGPIEQEQGSDTEFAAQADREPDAVVLAAVVDGEADAGEVGPKESSHAEGHATRQFGEDVDRLEFLGVDVGFAGPINIVVIDWSKGDVVRLAAFE